MGVKAKRHFGQNFLKDDLYVSKIIESIPDCARELRVVEIGTGLGDLTSRLLSCWDILTFEVDMDLRPYLERRFQKELATGRLEIRFGDVMEEWQGHGLLAEPYVLVSNLPYYIATAMILKALKDPMCRSLVVMVQKEVAEKFCAHQGERDFSALSVIAQSYGDVRLLFEVPPGAFEPVPKVTSAVFRLDKIREAIPSGLEALLRLAFSAPRKKLIKNLSCAYQSGRLKEIFLNLGISEDSRPHELETSHYHRLLNILSEGLERHDGRE